MSRQVCLGRYGEKFGAPELSVAVRGGRVGDIRVLRGAPCGATWRAAERLKDAALAGAAERFGLEVQYGCTADPAGWDPIHGKSPVHFAGHVHAAALRRALA